MKLFLDSSVIAKLYIEERGSEGAQRLMQLADIKEVEIFAAELALYEVGNTILRNLRTRNRNASEYMMQLFLLNIEFIHVDSDIASKAMSVAIKHGVTYYDAVHVALSQENDANLVTEDKKLLKKFNIAIDIEEALKGMEKV